MLRINADSLKVSSYFSLGENSSQNSAENTGASLLHNTSRSVALTVVTDGQRLFPRNS